MKYFLERYKAQPQWLHMLCVCSSQSSSWLSPTGYKNKGNYFYMLFYMTVKAGLFLGRKNIKT